MRRCCNSPNTGLSRPPSSRPITTRRCRSFSTIRGDLWKRRLGSEGELYVESDRIRDDATASRGFAKLCFLSISKRRVLNQEPHRKIKSYRRSLQNFGCRQTELQRRTGD